MTRLWHLLRELRDFLRFFRTRRPQRDLVFYAEDASYHTFFQGLVEHLRAHTEVPFCYVTSDAHDPILSQSDGQMRCFYIGSLLFLFMLLVDAKLVVMTMPDLHRFHIKRSMRGARHVYLFHNIGSYFHVIREMGVLHYDVIFCVGPHHLRELRREEEIFDVRPRKLVEFGYYRLDAILAEHRRRAATGPSGPGRTFFAPGWGPWHERTSMLDLCGRELINNLLDAGHEIVFRPHPMSRIKYPETLDALYADFASRKGFTVDENVSNLEPYHTCDVMISDWSGVAYEFAFGVEKPVVFIDSPMKVNNPRYLEWGFAPVDVAIREEIGIVVGLEEVDRIAEVVARVVRERAVYRERIARARERLVFHVGRSSEAGVRYLLDALEQTE